MVVIKYDDGTRAYLILARGNVMPRPEGCPSVSIPTGHDACSRYAPSSSLTSLLEYFALWLVAMAFMVVMAAPAAAPSQKSNMMSRETYGAGGIQCARLTKCLELRHGVKLCGWHRGQVGVRA